MEKSLADRQKEYEQAFDFKIIRRIPIVIRVDGRSFSRITRKLPRPFCPLMMEVMAETMLEVSKKLDGAIFAYQQSDEINFLLRNDQTVDTEPFFGNRIQKITSIAAATTTLAFNRLKESSGLKLAGEAIFDARVVGVPTVTESINNLIWRQQDCTRNAITNAALAELGKKYGRKTAAKILHGRNAEERKEILLDDCEIDFDTYYPSKFRYGIAVFKAPKIIETESHGQVTRNKWVIDYNIPKFTEDREFVLDILNSGRDILRAERDLVIDESNTNYHTETQEK